jgi:hypothetical protein
MKHTFSRSLLLALTSATLAACGSDGSDTGTGSGTLRVDGDVEASPELANADAPTDFTTSFHVRVTKDGAPVTTGEVVITSDGGEVALIYDAEDRDGRWRGTQAGYHGTYALDVVSGDDYVTGAQLEGPDIHVFTAPALTGAVDATQPLVVEWSREVEADEATLETKEMDAVAISDLGTFELPTGALKSKPDETEQEEIRIERASRIPLAGGVAGSELRVLIENRLELVVAPTGL